MSSAFPIEVLERKRGTIALVTINGLAPNNTFSLELLVEFQERMRAAAAEADAVLVSSSNDKFFSNGLDGRSMLEKDARGRLETVVEMIRAFGNLVRLSKPWAVEIAGHAMAGGAVISSAADYRFMLRDSGRIGWTELLVGLPLPLVYMHGMHKIVHPQAVRGLFEGAALKPEEALGIGLLDGLADSREELHKQALKRLDQVLRLEQSVYLGVRSRYRSDLLRLIEQDEAEDVRLAAEAAKSPAFEQALRNIAGRN